MKKKLWLLATCALCIAFTSCKQTQELPQENMVAKSELDQYKRQVERLRAELAQKEAQIQQLTTDKGNLQSEVASTKAELNEVSRQMQASSDDYGVWFRVQIGAYGDRRISEDLQTTDQMALEGDDVQKVALGRFRNYDDAKALQTHLKDIGLKDAWVVSYKDGERVPIESVKN